MIKYLKTAMSVEMSYLWGILNAVRTEPKEFNHMSFNMLRNAAHLFLSHVKHSSHRHMVFQYFTCETTVHIQVHTYTHTYTKTYII